jgi:uncharacterized protein (DUF983 family)
MPYGLILWRGLTKRCPICGERKLFRRWVRMVDDCPRCGLHFYRAPGHWLGAWFLNVCFVQAVFLAIIFGFMLSSFDDPPVTQMLVVAGVVALVLPWLFFPFSRTIWEAIDLMVQPLSLDDGVAPGFELELAEAARARPPRPSGRRTR